MHGRLIVLLPKGEEKTLFADDLYTITPIHDLDEFKRFMEG